MTTGISLIIITFTAFMFCVYLISNYFDRRQKKIDEENNRRANFDWEYHNDYNKKVFGDMF
jgi:hypothetical protein